MPLKTVSTRLLEGVDAGVGRSYPQVGARPATYTYHVIPRANLNGSPTEGLGRPPKMPASKVATTPKRWRRDSIGLAANRRTI
jgi:hypothetical protein